MADYKKLSLQESQAAALVVLKKIVEICRINNLNYFLTYGTLIGAVRNGGIIPWDDDIDIMMPRPDYDKFVSYCKLNRDSLSPFQLFNNEINPDYPHMISRFGDNRYYLKFENEKDYGIGVFVDIYPLDGVGNDLKKAKKLINKNKRLASLCFLTSRKKFARDNTNSFARMIIKYPAYLWAKMMGNKHYIKKLSKSVYKFDYNESNLVACSVWPAGNGKVKNCDIFDKALFETKSIKFEDGYFNVPIGYDKFLSAIYGNYMQPPEPEDRKVHHSYDSYLKIE